MGRRSREERRRTAAAERTTAAAQTDRAVAPPGASVDGRIIVVVALTLAVVIFALFGQVRTHQFLNHDDDIYVTANEHVRAGLTADGIRWAFRSMDFNWHPVTWLTHMLDVQLFGVNAGRHLLVNVLLHALNSILLLMLLVRATRRVWESAAVAALFALHPLHVESVAWVAERKDVLSTLFFLLAIDLYVRYTQSRSRWTYAGLIAAFVVGLMSKGMLVTLPFLLLLLDYWPLRRITGIDRRSLTPLILEKLPLFLIVIPASIVTYVAQRSVSAVSDFTKIPLLPRLANAAISYVAYLGKAVWPSRLSVLYPYRLVVSPTEAFLSLLVLVAITVFVLRMRATRPWLFTGWFWFLGTLVPVIGIVQIGAQAMADRYTYVPLVGIFIAVVWTVAAAVRRPATLATAAALILIALSVVTFRQVGYWRDSVTLFSHAAAVTPPHPAIQTGLGLALLSERDYDGAKNAFDSAVRLNPRLALARRGLGTALVGLGDTAGAERELRTAVALDPSDAAAQAVLANVLVSSGRKAEAIEHFQKGLAIRDDPQARAALAAAQGNDDAAIAAYAQAIAGGVDTAEVHNDYAAALARKGRDAEALTQYEAALRIDPAQYDAHMNIGALYSRMDRIEDAAAHFAAAAKLRPASSEPNVYLALIHAQTGRFREAVADVDAAIKADPVAANQQLTNAIRIPFKPTNIEEYRAFLDAKAQGR